MIDDIIDPEERELRQVDAAARESAHEQIFAPADWFPCGKVGGKEAPLEPFSFGRQCAAQRLGISARSPLESAVLVVYLCTLPRQVVAKVRTPEAEVKFREQMEDWADRLGIGFASKTERQISAIASAIWSSLAASDGSPKITGSAGTPDPND